MSADLPAEVGVLTAPWSNAKGRVPGRPGACFLTSMKALLQSHTWKSAPISVLLG